MTWICHILPVILTTIRSVDDYRDMLYLWDRFTNVFLLAIQIQCKIRLAVIMFLVIRWQQFSAHVTTEQLSRHVPNFVASTMLESKWAKRIFHEIWITIRYLLVKWASGVGWLAGTPGLSLCASYDTELTWCFCRCTEQCGVSDEPGTVTRLYLIYLNWVFISANPNFISYSNINIW